MAVAVDVAANTLFIPHSHGYVTFSGCHLFTLMPPLCPYNGCESLHAKVVADIQASVTSELRAKVDAIASLRSERSGTTASRLWSVGLAVLKARNEGRNTSEVGRLAISLVPLFPDVPKGSTRLSFRVSDHDLVQARLLATDTQKEAAQIHRNALLIGVWVWDALA